MQRGNANLIEIFDPPMCSPTGLCGPSIDSVLLEIQEAVVKVRQGCAGRARGGMR
jgi:hypothetical protein